MKTDTPAFLVELLDVAMLEVPIWPLGPHPHAQNGLRRRLHTVPGSTSDARLTEAMTSLLTDWGEGQLGPLDRAPLKLAIVHWTVATAPQETERR